MHTKERIRLSREEHLRHAHKRAREDMHTNERMKTCTQKSTYALLETISTLATAARVDFRDINELVLRPLVSVQGGGKLKKKGGGKESKVLHYIHIHIIHNIDVCVCVCV